MKGKESLAAANRRTHQAQQEIERLKTELASEKAKLPPLQAEIARLKAQHFTEAQGIAEREVKRQMEALEKERRSRGLSDDIVRNMLYRKDMLMRNACRFVSMTQGVGPGDALLWVLTWATDKRWVSSKNISRLDLLIELGVPSDGWVARALRFEGRWASDQIRITTVPLDEALSNGDERIHPKYNDKWYPPIDYGGIVVVDEEGA